jgi:hypothetical protein
MRYSAIVIRSGDQALLIHLINTLFLPITGCDPFLGLPRSMSSLSELAQLPSSTVGFKLGFLARNAHELHAVALLCPQFGNPATVLPY